MSLNETKTLHKGLIQTLKNQNDFLEFVYKKIARDTINRFVDKTEDSVEIILSNHPSIKVIPIFKEMDKNNLFLDFEVAKALQVIDEGDFTLVCFVYPKNQNFDKHIELKISALEEKGLKYMVKIIPYSLQISNKYKGN